MPQTATILDDVEVLLPVLSPCDHNDGRINSIFITLAGEEAFVSDWGQGSEVFPDDYCLDCESVGELEDAEPYFFIPAVCKPYQDDGCTFVIALKMNIGILEMLTRLLNNYIEERTRELRVYPATDEQCEGLADAFHAFVQEGNDGDFGLNDWEFDKPRFVENLKAVTLSINGIQLQCDISTKGDNEQEMGTVETLWLSRHALGELNSWLVSRTKPSQR
jgi:hypothetical protein